MKQNYHTHSIYCDGTATLREYVEKAIIEKFSVLGFSSHAAMEESNGYSIALSAMPKYVQEIKTLKEEYASAIEILLGLELDYIPPYTFSFSELKERLALDYTIGAVHLVKAKEGLWFIDGGDSVFYDQGLQDYFQGDIKMGVRAYFDQVNEMLDVEKPDILAHFDKISMHNQARYFSKKDAWYVSLVDQTIDHIAKTDTIVELNVRGLYKKRSDDFFPSKEIIQKLKQYNIPVVISMDAHKPEELAFGWEDAFLFLKGLGYKPAGKSQSIEIYR